MIRRRRQQKDNFITWLLKPFFPGRGSEHNPDKVLLVSVGLLLFLGLIFLSSASSTLAFDRYSDAYRFLKQQITHGILPGILFFYIAFRINYKVYEKLLWLWLVLSFILLLLVLLVGGDFGTAKSWIVIGSVSVQPAEMVKLLVILFLSSWFVAKGREIKDLKGTTVPFVIFLALISLLIILQPDFGTLSIIVLTSLALYYVAGAKLSHLLTMFLAGLVGFFVMIKTAPYRMERITAWLDPNVDTMNAGWQIKQSLIAVGSGGWFGIGLGASKQKSYLPMPANDSIFAVIAEELGFIFTFLFLLLFVTLIYRGFLIARRSPDNFAKLVALGITTWLALQIFVNIGGMIKLMPLTGVPLPFISLGGTNLVVTLIAMGILANISKFTTER
ncbi:putative lipid II flippase FtsW [Candidatus Parcubacteria bacterium]|nr:MAG: putative lipid II flippase FtsW [Candidatus Parcubacteria bacterium]